MIHFAVYWSHIYKAVDWSDPATWLASIGTVGVLVLGLIQYIRNSHRQEKRLHKEQAKNVTAWVVSNNGQKAVLAISNQSKNPIYEVVLTLVPFQGAGDPTGKKAGYMFRAFLSVVPPGLYYAQTQGHSGMHFHPSANVVFTDNSGNNWLRSGRGVLSEIKQPATKYLDLELPLSWSFPSKDIP